MIAALDATPAPSRPASIRLNRPARAVLTTATIQDVLSISHDQLLEMIEDGRLRWVFDISSRQHRRNLRILTADFVSFLDGIACPVQTVDAAIALILPAPTGDPRSATIRATTFCRRLGCNQGLSAALIRCKALLVAPRPRRRFESHCLLYASVVQFLRRRCLSSTEYRP